MEGELTAPGATSWRTNDGGLLNISAGHGGISPIMISPLSTRLTAHQMIGQKTQNQLLEFRKRHHNPGRKRVETTARMTDSEKSTNPVTYQPLCLPRWSAVVGTSALRKSDCMAENMLYSTMQPHGFVACPFHDPTFHRGHFELLATAIGFMECRGCYMGLQRDVGGFDARACVCSCGRVELILTDRRP